MPHPFDPDAIGRTIVTELSTLLQDDIKHHAAFAERQAKALAKQAAWIAEASIAGELNDDDRDWFVENLKRMTENFVRTLVGLTILTIEKAWNAVVNVLWGAINAALEAARMPFTFSIPAQPRG
jgi:hypothetical protein